MGTKLIHGDCLEIMKLMPDKSVDISFTSPPYNRKRNDKYEFFNDVIDDYFMFLCNFTENLLRITKKHVFINIQKNFYNKKDVFKYIGRFSSEITEIIVWEKTNPMPASGFNITNAYEMFIVLSDKPLKANKTYTKNVITSSVNSDKISKTHKAVMKQEISDWFIKTFTEENDVILDCFMGLGTTGISCKKFNRDFIGIEIDENYFKIAEERINETNVKSRQEIQT